MLSTRCLINRERNTRTQVRTLRFEPSLWSRACLEAQIVPCGDECCMSEAAVPHGFVAFSHLGKGIELRPYYATSLLAIV
jgi:hypothetical protein